MLAWAVLLNSSKKLVAYDGNYMCTGSGGCVQDSRGKFKSWGACNDVCAGRARPYYACATVAQTPNGQPVYDPSKPCQRVGYATQFQVADACDTACKSEAQYFAPATCEPTTQVTRYKGPAGFQACMKALGKTPAKPKCPADCLRSEGKICENGACRSLTCNDVCPGFKGGGYFGYTPGAQVSANGCGMQCGGDNLLSCSTCAGEMCWTCTPSASI